MSPRRGAPTRAWKHHLIIMGTVLVSHGLLLLNDGVYWDGWLVYTHLVNRDWSSLHSWFSEAGAPIVAWFHWLLGQSPFFLFTYKAVVFASILLSAVLIYEIARRVTFVTREEGLLIALLALTYPAYQVTVELVMAPYSVAFCLLLFGWLLIYDSGRRKGLGAILGRAVAAGALWLSFTVNSLLVFHYGFVLVWFLQVWAQRQRGQNILKGFSWRLPFAGLPGVYWGVSQVFFPRHGLYSNYNRFVMSLGPMGRHARTFIENAVVEPLQASVKLLATNYWLLSLVLLSAVWLGWRLSRRAFRDASRSSFEMMAFGVILLGLGIFPYIAVGKVATIHGWTTRHALLVAVPVAVILVSLSRCLRASWGRWCVYVKTSLAVALLVAFSWANVGNYVEWQARWVKDRAIAQALAQSEGAAAVSVFWVVDQTMLAGRESYRFYEWAAMFRKIWGGESRIGLSAIRHSEDFLETGSKYFTRRYVLENFDPRGKQLLLVIRPGPAYRNNVALSTRYLYLRIFCEGKLAQFLSDVVELDLQPVGG